MLTAIDFEFNVLKLVTDVLREMYNTHVGCRIEYSFSIARLAKLVRSMIAELSSRQSSSNTHHKSGRGPGR